ncbi:hypothetical protein STEG23_025305, partial [Scotinomys teguina]
GKMVGFEVTYQKHTVQSPFSLHGAPRMDVPVLHLTPESKSEDVTVLSETQTLDLFGNTGNHVPSALAMIPHMCQILLRTPKCAS